MVLKYQSLIKLYKHTNLILKDLITDYVQHDTLTETRLLLMPDLIDAPTAYKMHINVRRPISAHS